MRSLPKIIAFIFALLLIRAPLTVSAAFLNSVSWEDLPRHIETLQADAPDTLADCPWDLDENSPHTVVLQWIENTFYKWREYKTDGGDTCIVMEEPVPGKLPREKAQVLLAASSLWQQAGTGGSQAVLDPSELAAAKPAPYSPTETAALASLMDNGPVYSPANPGDPQASFQTVFGADDRITPDTTQYPYNTIAYVSFNNGINAFRGTAFLISPYAALTNAHVVYDSTTGQWYQDVAIAPGQYEASGGIARPYGDQAAYQTATNTLYQSTGSVDYDYGAILLPAPFSGITTFMPLKFDVNLGNDSTLLYTSGYPGEVNGSITFNQWFDSANASGLSTGILARFYMDTSAGSSGSPVWLDDAGTQYVVAINSSEWNMGLPNGGPLLSSANQSLIESWLAWTPPGASADISTYYLDDDNDGYGDPTVSLEGYSQPAGYVTNNSDCDDTDNQIFPGATEVPDDGIDQDCSGEDLTTDTIGKLSGSFSKYVDPDQEISLYVNTANNDGVDQSDIVQEWVVFGAKIGLIPLGIWFYTDTGDVVEFAEGMDISPHTYNFDHSVETVFLADIKLGDLDLSTQDSFWHGYMYATTPLTTTSTSYINTHIENLYNLIVN